MTDGPADSTNPGSPPEPRPADPIFDGQEAVESPTRKSTLLFQFFLFPLLIVVASVGVFLFFGAIGGAPKSAAEFLSDVRTGGENVQKQAAQQLGAILQKERGRVDRKEIPLAEAEYAKGTFRQDLRAAFEESFDGKTTDRQAFLASALGLVGDPAFLPTLEKHASSPTPPDVRRSVALAIALLDTADASPVLVRLLKDDDELVRNYAVEGLSRRKAPSPGALEALRAALTDPSEYVRVNAASALALAGDASGSALVARLLEPAYAAEMAGRKLPDFTAEEIDADRVAEMRRFALASGLKAALSLRAAHRAADDPKAAEIDAFRPRIEALRTDPDEAIRKLSQQVLDRWGSPK